MRTLFATILLVCFISTRSFSQNFNMEDLISLRGADNSVVEKKLSTLNFSLYDEDIQNKHITQFTYQNNNINEKNPLQWIDYLTVRGAHWNNRISFQIQSISYLKKCLSEMKELDFYFSSKKIIDGLIYEIYTDGCNTIELITTQSRKVYDNNTYFNFILYSNGEYEYAFATENKKYNITAIDQNNLYAKLVDLPMANRK